MIYGWDMSHYDDPSIGSAISQGIRFLSHKAGGDQDDAELAAWWRGVKNLSEDIVLGAYWVLYPGRPEARADAFLARLDSQCPGWRDRDAFLLQLDCEDWTGDGRTKPSRADIRAAADRLAARTGGKYRPIVYASAGQYGSELAGLGYPLWNANYPHEVREDFRSAYGRAGGDSGRGWIKYSGQVPVIWQYTSSATIGGQTTCDANAFRGTVADLKNIITPGGDMPSVQDLLDGIYRDLRNDKSGISQELDRHLDAAIERALSTPRDWDAAAGGRVKARGWGNVSMWTLLEYLMDGLIAVDPEQVTNPDGTVSTVPGGVIPRLDRIEAAVTSRPAGVQEQHGEFDDQPQP